IGRAKARLTVGLVCLDNARMLQKRWADLLQWSIDGTDLKGAEPSGQLVSGRDFINMMKLSINAMPSKSITARERIADQACRAGCKEVETTGHILQRCFRTHTARIERHDSIVKYVKRNLTKRFELVETEPKILTPQGLRKPDLIGKGGDTLIVADAQIISEHTDLDTGHQRKVAYYKGLEKILKEKYLAREVK
ncbi:hypothetical protein KM043_018882, partial [Ampulex compressa]